MAVFVKYVVVRDGKEDMMFSTKKEADAYDKMLDIAERLYEFLHTADLNVDDDKLDALTFFMARHHVQLGKLLKGGKLEPSDADLTSAQATHVKKNAALATNDNHKASKRSRSTTSKAVA
jgi:dsDNA-binding SOS-regulon protein